MRHHVRAERGVRQLALAEPLTATSRLRGSIVSAGAEYTSPMYAGGGSIRSSMPASPDAMVAE